MFEKDSARETLLIEWKQHRLKWIQTSRNNADISDISNEKEEWTIRRLSSYDAEDDANSIQQLSFRCIVMYECVTYPRV